MRLTILGCGDAFNSGGRFSSSYLLEGGQTRFMLDCGPSTLPALKRASIDPNAIPLVFISHLHGDHIAGLPFLVLDGMFQGKRESPLTMIGPPGLEARYRLACEVFYPRFLNMPRPFPLNFVEIEKNVRREFDGIGVTPLEVDHFSGAPSFGFRFEVDDRLFAFSGDTGWTDNVIHAGKGADLYLIECCHYDLKLPMHLDYLTIEKNADRIGAKKLLLTHMCESMLARLADVDRTRFMLAEDGMVVDI